jgi:hypothetical protein
VSPLTAVGVPLELGAPSPLQLAGFQLDIDHGIDRLTFAPRATGSSGVWLDSALQLACAPRIAASR